MNQKVQGKMTLETHLRHALDRNELYPVYHPIIRLSDGAMVGAETLLRWKNPDLGLVSPLDFIPIAEQTGLIRPITEWLFDTILVHAAAWDRRPEKFWVGINVSPSYFCDETFRDTIEAVSNRASAMNLDLCVEITENLFLQAGEASLKQFKHLTKLGVSSAMDDFGTGYSSLAYIKRFPLNHLKIDRTFVDGLPGKTDDRSLTETIVLMGHRLGISLIAEGVENQSQYDYLKSLGVEYAQGFHIARPMAQEDFIRYIASYRPALTQADPLSTQLSSAGQ